MFKGRRHIVVCDSGRVGALPADIKPIDLAMTICFRAFPVRCPAGDNLWISNVMSKRSQFSTA